ncbi:hypothetical protein [Mesorhizobium sp.]|uniref:hypothetical protein n=1 Tax=Mesorhizobium sp. TaxID=1871066 RepID=UPI00257D4469|nr:hypothetical protein [Mesorhizobium sp.]
MPQIVGSIIVFIAFCGGLGFMISHVPRPPRTKGARRSFDSCSISIRHGRLLTSTSCI